MASCLTADDHITGQISRVGWLSPSRLLNDPWAAPLQRRQPGWHDVCGMEIALRLFWLGSPAEWVKKSLARMLRRAHIACE